MLKVVGASSVQTRVTLLTLGVVTLFGILTYYYGGVSPTSHDGNYAATVFWSRTSGYRLQFWGQNSDPSNVRKGVARAYYKPDMSSDGWASLEIEGQKEWPDLVQAHAAGLLEGSLSWQLIYYHWKNTIERTCEDRQHFCDQVRIILNQNTANIREQARALDLTDPFWHQVNLFYEQLDGLEVGWRYAVDRSRKDVDIPHQDFLWMNTACDLRDLELMYNATLETDPRRPSLGMALLKLVPGNTSQFLLAHASSSSYSAMLRVQKRYNLGLHMTGASGATKVPGQVVTFTSYPGAIHSQDDFYQVGTGSWLTVSGTTIKNLNQSLWAKAEVTTQVLMGPRVMAANRLARDGAEWAQVVGRSYSGTGNKQWLVVMAAPVRLWVVEQLPGLTRAGQQTDALVASSYWASYGLPHYKEILNISGAIETEHHWSTKIKVLSEGQSNVTDLESLICLMRSPDLALVGRSDLGLDEVHRLETGYQSRYHPDTATQSRTLPVTAPHFVHNFKEIINNLNAVKHLKQELREMEGNAPLKDQVMREYKVKEELPEIDLRIDESKKVTENVGNKHFLTEFSGVIDLKVSKQDGFLAAAGPPFSVSHGAVVVEPFQWSKSSIRNIPHVGQADVWNFDPVQAKWVWNKIVH